MITKPDSEFENKVDDVWSETVIRRNYYTILDYNNNNNDGYRLENRKVIKPDDDED